jgi:tRNA (adenine37-N6)-methyltransferase
MEMGIFATRAPCHPTDVLDGTPLLDIKPYTAKFDIMNNVESGWQDLIDEKTTQMKRKRGYKLDV